MQEHDTPAEAPQTQAMVTSHKRHHSAQKRGENLAFAVESVLTCWATDFIDPVFMYFVQKQHAKKHGGEHGTGWQNAAGEIGGDIIGAITLLSSEKLFPHQMETVARGIGDALDPVYRQVAQKSLKLDFAKPEDVRRYDEWREYQQNNLVKMAVLTVGSVGGNVGLQKTPWLGNPSPAHVILKGKLGGAAITAGVVIGWRTAFPDTSKKVDSWLSRKVFAPVIEKTDKLFGRKKEEGDWAAHVEQTKPDHSLGV